MAESFFEFREKLTRRPDAAPPAKGKPLSVAELTRQIDRALKDNLPASVSVQGELSNFNAHAGSGHFYFTMKDADACIDCVMFRSDAARVKFRPSDGLELVASGRVGVYAQRGRYQLYVTSMQPIGKGALELAFQQLRAKLDGEGLFARERKKPLPAFPLRIALVTGGQAAAMHDMLKVLGRFPWLQVFVYAVPVQGEGSGAKVAAALAHINRCCQEVGGVDVIILGRGGGSLEDLWAFNEEVVAQAVAASKIPIITGIGHEVDVSIADLVADYHAHTPTEAAQVVTAQWRNIGEAIDQLSFRLNRVVRGALTEARRRIDSIERHEVFRRPLDRVNALRQLLDDRQRAMLVAMNARMWDLQRDLREIEESLRAHSPSLVVAKLSQKLISHEQRLGYAQTTHLEKRKLRLDSLERALRALSPDAVLQRGYSMTTLKKDGKVVRSVEQVRGGEKLITRLADGTIESTADDPKQPGLF